MANIKVLNYNRKATYDYFIEEKFEAGLVLVGTEVKALRKGSVQIKDAFISIRDNEAYIKGMFIPQYEFGNQFNHQEVSDRKLLLHKKEIKYLQKEVKLSGLTIVPLSLYFKDGRVKLELALARGKKLHDKRQVSKEKSAKREIEKALKLKY